MPHEVDLLQPQTIKHTQQFSGAFGQPDETRAIFLASIHNDAPRPAERFYLARIYPFQVFEDGYEDQGFALADIDKRHIDVPSGNTLPERFDILHIGMKSGFVNSGTGGDSRGVHDAPLAKRWTERNK